ncbi:MAG: hypothetical protein RIS90_1220 [Pseudomonadota bacterium]|jgi:Xaa-Pro aminopeptidase
MTKNLEPSSQSAPASALSITGNRPWAEFPKEEFDARFARLQIEMYRNDLVALIATTEANCRYLTGARNQRWPNTLRPHCVILPVTGAPVVIQGASDNFGLKDVTWIEDLRGFGGKRRKDGYGAHMNDLIVDVLAEKGIRQGRIGVERDWQMHAGFSINDFLALEKRLAPLELVDAASLWWEVRMIKSPLEIDCMRRSAQITSAAYRDLGAEIRIGMTESEIERRMCILMLKHGAERPTYVPVNCHAGRWPSKDHLVFGLSTERRLENNSLVDMDGGCTFKGYWSDFSRTYAVGKPPAKALVAYRIAQDAILAGKEAIRPGRPITDVYRAMARCFNQANKLHGLSESGMSESGINGHGTGLSATERPYINLEDTTIMTPGLCTTIEPIFSVDGYGMMLGEDMFVVTESGYEQLSESAPPEMPIVG